jgi:nuclear pore complex protein Nup93
MMDGCRENCRVHPTNLDKLMSEWNSSIRDYLADAKSVPKGDVFKYALYKIMGRCDLSQKNIRSADVITTTEDYLWLNLTLIHEEILPTDTPLEKFTLRDFSLTMQKYGLAHLKTPATWFMVLLLCGEFEVAVYELCKNPSLAADAMHFAIAMAYYGVLRVPESPKIQAESGTLLNTVQITLQSGAAYKVNHFHFAKIIVKFVKQWVQTDTSEMLHYLYLVGLYGSPPNQQRRADENMDGKEYTSFILQTVREILAQVKNYAQILGQFSTSGARMPGHIEVHRSLICLASVDEYLQRVVTTSAEDAERAAKYKEAVQLFHLANQCNKAIELMNTLLGTFTLNIRRCAFEV